MKSQVPRRRSGAVIAVTTSSFIFGFNALSPQDVLVNGVNMAIVFNMLIEKYFRFFLMPFAILQ